MKTLITILSIFILLGCKTKKVVKTKSEEISTEKIATEKKEKKQIEKSAQKQEEKKVDASDKKKESETDIEIKGKSESDKPLELFQIENGDTLKSIKITGNAEVLIKSKTKNSDFQKKENSAINFSNKVEEIASNLVKEENLKKTGKKINNAAKETVTRTGTFWSFGLISVLGVVALILLALFFYFKNYRKKN